MSKYRVGEKSKNDNRVDSFIWHLGVSEIVNQEQEEVLKKENNFLLLSFQTTL